jgi:hypothetical protein
VKGGQKRNKGSEYDQSTKRTYSNVLTKPLNTSNKLVFKKGKGKIKTSSEWLLELQELGVN